MRASAFETWAQTRGGLKADSARSYVSYLASVESDYSLDLDREWQQTKLTEVRSRLGTDRNLNENTRRNRMSALSKYEDFCSVND